jgi:hypothetical protein
LRALTEKNFRDRGGHCSGVGFIFLPLPKRALITNPLSQHTSSSLE